MNGPRGLRRGDSKRRPRGFEAQAGGFEAQAGGFEAQAAGIRLGFNDSYPTIHSLILQAIHVAWRC